jgi:hypothetical protein
LKISSKIPNISSRFVDFLPNFKVTDVMADLGQRRIIPFFLLPPLIALNRLKKKIIWQLRAIEESTEVGGVLGR